MKCRFATSVSMIIVVVLAGCSPSETATSTTSQTSSTSTPSQSTTSTISEDVQTGIDWFVGVLNGDELGEDEYIVRFTDDFRQQVPFDSFSAVVGDLGKSAPYTVTERTGSGTSGQAIAEGTDGISIRISATLDDQGRFSSLLVEPTEPPSLDDPPATVTEAFDRLADIGTTKALAAEVVDGECVPIESIQIDEPAPLGSVFKLYVLAALGDAVNSGQVSWDDEIVIRDELKSIPSGVLQEREDGDTVTVLEAAELMISISDNTATDHLIDLLGREVVEAALGDYGNQNASLTIPFPTTRELTALKIGPAEGLRDPQWIEGDEEERRAILDQISGITVDDLPLQDWNTPIDPDLVEWFASPNDLCRLAVGLMGLAGDVSEIAGILEINPGVPAEEGTWDRVWFKGGSEPGLIAVWWVTESDGRVFVTTGSVVNPDAEIDSDQAVLLLAAARDLLAGG